MSQPQATFENYFSDYRGAVKAETHATEFDKSMSEKYGLSEGSAKSRRSTLIREFRNMTTEFEKDGDILNGEQLRVKLKVSRKDVHNAAEDNGWEIATEGKSLKPLPGGKRGRQVQVIDVTELSDGIDDVCE